MKRFASILLLTLLINTLSAQQNFTVLALSGEVKANEKDVHVGQVLSGEFSISLGAESYLGLIHESGKPLELSQAGAYKGNELMAKLNAADGSFSDQFAAYISEEMSSGDGAYQNNMAITGSVERAIKDYSIFIPLPKKSTFVGDRLDLVWVDKNANEGEQKYIIEVMDMMEDIVYSSTCSSTEFSFNPFENEDIEEDDFYLIKIRKSNTDEVSNVVGIYLPDGEDLEELHAEIKPLLSAKGSTLEMLAAVQILKNKNYYTAALSKLKEILASDPENKIAQEAYNSYLEEIE